MLYNLLILNDNLFIVDGEGQALQAQEQLALSSMYRKKRAVASPFSLSQKTVLIQQSTDTVGHRGTAGAADAMQ